MKIARVESFHIVVNREEYAATGEHPVGTVSRRRPSAAPGVRELERNEGRNLCAYPDQAQTLLVRITTDDGIVGWGEAHSPPVPRVAKAVIAELFTPLLLGRDPMAVEVLWDELYASMRLRGHGAGFQLEALAGIDIALWDIIGKALDQPIYGLLGGPFRTRIPCYTGVPGDTLEERVTYAKDYVAQGFTTLKTGVALGDFRTGLAEIATVVEAVGEQATVLVDAHGVYDARTAIPAGRELERLGVGWLEDPLPPEDIDGYAALCAALDMPIASGETECTRWQFQEKLSRRAADIILPDICRAGGISEGRKIALVADLFNVPWCAHVSMGSAVHLAAALHVAAATPNFLICEYRGPLHPNPLGDVLLREPIHYETGHLQVPDGPGLGITFDDAALAAHSVDPYESAG
ncbi:MAG: hypothetical protein CL878_04625 [Dehalococcoidia bacterium]|nr:hypothetical protein [Dehalococcoidia bacterium]